MPEFIFLTTEDIKFIHRREIETAGGSADIRDVNAIEACTDSPKQTHGGVYLMDIFDMAATYVVSICIRHPFLDGNKRTALASSLAFLYLNGYEINESHPLELADLILDSLEEKMDRETIGNYFRLNAQKINA